MRACFELREMLLNSGKKAKLQEVNQIKSELKAKNEDLLAFKTKVLNDTKYLDEKIETIIQMVEQADWEGCLIFHFLLIWFLFVFPAYFRRKGANKTSYDPNIYEQ